MLLVQKGVGTRSHSIKGVGTPFPRVPTRLHHWALFGKETWYHIIQTLLLFCVFISV